MTRSVLLWVLLAGCFEPPLEPQPDAGEETSFDGGFTADSGPGNPVDGGDAGDTDRPVDAGNDSDAGTTLDAGNAVDGGGTLDGGRDDDDAGRPVDGGDITDAGVTVDAGHLTDAGDTADAGGLGDAGSTSDGGLSTDAGFDRDAGPISDGGSIFDAGTGCWPSPPTVATTHRLGLSSPTRETAWAAGVWEHETGFLLEREIEGEGMWRPCLWAGQQQTIQGVEMTAFGFGRTNTGLDWIMASGSGGAFSRRVLRAAGYYLDGGQAWAWGSACNVLWEFPPSPWPKGSVYEPPSSSGAETFWGIVTEYSSLRRPFQDLLFWWSTSSRDGGVFTAPPNTLDIRAADQEGAHVAWVIDGGPTTVSVLSLDGGMTVTSSWNADVAECRFRAAPDQLWCTSSDRRLLLAFDRDGGHRVVHDGGEPLWLVRPVRRADTVLFFSNSGRYEAPTDGGFRVFAIGADWAEAHLMFSAPTRTEFVAGELDAGFIRSGMFEPGPVPGGYRLNSAAYCFPRSGP